MSTSNLMRHSVCFCSQAQTFAALKAWCHWLSQLHTVSLKNPSPSARGTSAYEQQCRDLTSRIMMAVAPVIRDAGSSPEVRLVKTNLISEEVINKHIYSK